MSNAPDQALQDLENAFEEASIDDIIERLEALEKEHPDDVLVQVARARLDAAEGDVDGARAKLEKLAGSKARGADVARAYFGALLSDAGEHKKAVSQIETAMKKGADVPAARHALGFSLLSQGKYKEALPHLEKAAEAMPSSAPTYYFLGQGFELAKDFQSAAVAYANCVAVLPTYDDAFASLVRAHAMSGDLETAATAVEEGLKHLPDDGTLLRLRVTVAADRGDHDGAKKALLAIPEGQRNVEDLANLALLSLESGDVDGAIQAAKDAVASDGSHWRGHHLLGIALESQSPPDIAGAKAAHAASIDAGDPYGEAGARLGWLWLTADPADPKKAREVLEAAHTRSPEHPGVLLHLALACRETDDEAAAKANANAVLASQYADERERGQAQKLLDELTGS